MNLWSFHKCADPQSRFCCCWFFFYLFSNFFLLIFVMHKSFDMVAFVRLAWTLLQCNVPIFDFIAVGHLQLYAWQKATATATFSYNNNFMTRLLKAIYDLAVLFAVRCSLLFTILCEIVFHCIAFVPWIEIIKNCEANCNCKLFQLFYWTQNREQPAWCDMFWHVFFSFSQIEYEPYQMPIKRSI